MREAVWRAFLQLVDLTSILYIVHGLPWRPLIFHESHDLRALPLTPPFNIIAASWLAVSCHDCIDSNKCSPIIIMS